MIAFEQLEPRNLVASAAFKLELLSFGDEFEIGVFAVEWHPYRAGIVHFELRIDYPDDLIQQTEPYWITPSLPGGLDKGEHVLDAIAAPGMGAGQPVGNLGWEHVASMYFETIEPGPVNIDIDPGWSTIGTMPVSSLSVAKNVDLEGWANYCEPFTPEQADQAIEEMTSEQEILEGLPRYGEA